MSSCSLCIDHYRYVPKAANDTRRPMAEENVQSTVFEVGQSHILLVRHFAFLTRLPLFTARRSPFALCKTNPGPMRQAFFNLFGVLRLLHFSLVTRSRCYRSWLHHPTFKLQSRCSNLIHIIGTPYAATHSTRPLHFPSQTLSTCSSFTTVVQHTSLVSFQILPS